MAHGTPRKRKLKRGILVKSEKNNGSLLIIVLQAKRPLASAKSLFLLSPPSTKMDSYPHPPLQSPSFTSSPWLLSLFLSSLRHPPTFQTPLLSVSKPGSLPPRLRLQLQPRLHRRPRRRWTPPGWSPGWRREGVTGF